MSIEDEDDWHDKIQTKYNKHITVGERRLRNLLDMNDSSKYNIKGQDK